MGTEKKTIILATTTSTQADRGTYLALQKNLGLNILAEGDAILLNIYHVIEVNPAKWPKVNAAGGKTFADFMIARETQEVKKHSARTSSARPSFFLMPAKELRNWASNGSYS